MLKIFASLALLLLAACSTTALPNNTYNPTESCHDCHVEWPSFRLVVTHADDQATTLSLTSAESRKLAVLCVASLDNNTLKARSIFGDNPNTVSCSGAYGVGWRPIEISDLDKQGNVRVSGQLNPDQVYLGLSRQAPLLEEITQ